MAPRLSGSTSKFGFVFFVGIIINRPRDIPKFAFLITKPRNHVRIVSSERVLLLSLTFQDRYMNDVNIDLQKL